ncbi:RHS repeat-associated core domain-containing protein, partial [Maribacter polysiphoniae]
MKNHIYTLVAVLMANMAMAQTQPTLTFSGESSGDHIATQSITLSPGFHTTSFSAKIVSDAYIPVAKSDENYIFTRTYQSGMTSSSGISENKDVLESISYFDGLGRPMQQIGIKAAPDKEDIITHIEYDGFGRQDKDWLPYHEPSGTLGTYRGNKASATRSYYKSNYGSDFPTMGNTTANAYSEKDFEPSPLNRVLKQAAPGEDWKMEGSHEIEFGYDTNTTNEVRLFKVTTTFANNTYTPSLVQSGYYTAGELYKNITYDENHSSGTDHSTEEFTDKQGRVVLKRTYDSGAHDTYYVYDDFGNLTYVIPPKVTTASVSATELNELCYQYKYDQRNRLVEKKIPGKGTSTTWEEIVYNKLDQPVLTRDPNLRVQGKWLFTKYDAFGRVAYTGTINNGASRISLQGSANGYTGNLWVGPGTTTIDSRTISYNNSGYPNTNYGELHTVNYYDTYVDTDGLSVPSTVLGQPKATNTQGLATVSKVKVLDTGDWITSITGYDKKGRAIYTASKNDYLVTTDIVETELDFGGKVEQTKATHTKGTNAAIVTVDTFTYDHMGRLL